MDYQVFSQFRNFRGEDFLALVEQTYHKAPPGHSRAKHLWNCLQFARGFLADEWISKGPVYALNEGYEDNDYAYEEAVNWIHERWVNVPGIGDPIAEAYYGYVDNDE